MQTTIHDYTPKDLLHDEQLDAGLSFDNLPPFPEHVPLAPLLRVSLSKLVNGSEEEVNKLWKACCELGFFYLDLRDAHPPDTRGYSKSLEESELTHNVWEDLDRVDSATDGVSENPKSTTALLSMQEVDVDGEELLQGANELFEVGKSVFDLPVEEKVKYDLKEQGSYFGYKGYGQGIVDAQGTKDRNEFYNVSKDDILGISHPLPAPDLLNSYRDLLKTFIQHSHAIVNLLLGLLNSRLGLPYNKLSSLHRLQSVSGDQVRWVHAPPQPENDQRTALGEHTDFGSITILFNRLGGLQVLPPDAKEWCYVKPLRGHAVVNLGDAMVKFTAGVLRSNIHRVVNPPGRQAGHTRMSLVYFARPEDDVLLRVLDGSALIDERRQTLEADDGEEITSKEWILRRALGRRQGGDWSKSGGTENGRVGK